MYKAIHFFIVAIVAVFVYVAPASANEADRIYNESERAMVSLFHDTSVSAPAIREQARALGIPDSTPIIVSTSPALPGPASSGSTIYLPVAALDEDKAVLDFLLLHEYHHVLQQDVKAFISLLVSRQTDKDVSSLHLIDLLSEPVDHNVVNYLHAKEYAADRFAIDQLVPRQLLKPELIKAYLLKLSGSNEDQFSTHHPTIRSRINVMVTEINQYASR